MEIYAISALVLIVCMMVCCIMMVKNLNITIAVKHEYPEKTVEPSNIEVSEADDDDAECQYGESVPPRGEDYHRLTVHEG